MKLTFRRSVGNIFLNVLNTLNTLRFVHTLQEPTLNLKLCLSVCVCVSLLRYFGVSNTNFFPFRLHAHISTTKSQEFQVVLQCRLFAHCHDCASCTQQHNFPNTFTKCSGNRPDQNVAHNKTCCKVSLHKTSAVCIPELHLGCVNL
jgi:hypothetical protein